MVTDLSRLPSQNCPAARALRLRERLASRRGPAWAIADALAQRWVKIEFCAGPVSRKLRPGATTPTYGHSLGWKIDQLPEPPWQQEAEDAMNNASVAVLAAPIFVAMENTLRLSRLRPQALVRACAIPSLCLTARLLPIPAARVA